MMENKGLSQKEAENEIANFDFRETIWKEIVRKISGALDLIYKH